MCRSPIDDDRGFILSIFPLCFRNLRYFCQNSTTHSPTSRQGDGESYLSLLGCAQFHTFTMCRSTNVDEDEGHLQSLATHGQIGKIHSSSSLVMSSNTVRAHKKTESTRAERKACFRCPKAHRSAACKSRRTQS